ncbi:Crp/Fnr family transcriptional regulator [Sphingomonas sp. S6]|jgi:CRP-like cAMP-binding protein|uniref:Crp/Fnr family transcriptional regulator n=1 Tax=Sphingomonas sp. S6 TaxID=3368600 RepID=UPI000FBF95E7|nr:Crp/Fnr family transcriptional regulator [uncultured Sphingomonas sp.]RTL16861.1 MAG: Crp/Fnr family transcriptional regulator [Sphingomonadaceae bacterium]
MAEALRFARHSAPAARLADRGLAYPAAADASFVALAVAHAVPDCPDAQQALQQATLPPRTIRAGTDLVREGDRADRLYVVVKGWAYRYLTARDGARQISAVLVPGDVANIDTLAEGGCGSGIRAVTPLEVSAMTRDRAQALAADHVGIARMFLLQALADHAVLSRWTLYNGRLPALERLACLICELSLRCGGEQDNCSQFEMPLTQELLADVLGLTAVHVNRMMQRLRADALIVTDGRMIHIPDVTQLRRRCDFDPQYLRHHTA